jgi:hypothetical protein
LHTEEIGIEDGCEDDLVYGDFGEEGEETRGIVEGGGEEHEPI